MARDFEDLHDIDDLSDDELRDLVLGSGGTPPDGALWFTDLPLNGVLLVALSAWALRLPKRAARRQTRSQRLMRHLPKISFG